MSTSTNTLTTAQVEELLQTNTRVTQYAMAREVHLLICALVIAYKSEYSDFYCQVEICKAYLGQFIHLSDKERWMALGHNPFPRVEPAAIKKEEL